MTVDITQEEMNILNLNGLKTEDVKGNVDFLRMTGLSDEAIRNRYDELLNELKPITKTNINDTQNIAFWNNKGAITPFEFAVRKTDDVFDDSTLYPDRINIDETAGLTKDEIEQLKRVRANYQEWKEKHPERVKGQEDYNSKKNNWYDTQKAKFTSSFIIVDDGREISQKVKDIMLHEINSETGYYQRPKEKKEGKIDFWESLNETFKSDEWLPIVGGYVEGAKKEKQRELFEKIYRGQDIRPDEYQYLNDLVEKQKEENVRGRTIGSHIAESLLPSIIRFGGEMAIGGWVLRGLGLTPRLGATGIKADGAVYSTLKDRAVYGLKDMALTGTANTLNPLTGGTEIYSAYQERRLNDTYELTSKGEMIFKEAKEKPATAFLKAMGDTFIMFASEASGSLIGIPIEGTGNVIKKYAASPISAYAKSNQKLVSFYENVMPKLSELYQKTLGVKGLKGTRDFLKSATRYDGFLEEIGEEKLEDLLALTLGLNDEERTLDNYIKAIKGTPDEWAVLTGTIALQGLLLSGSSHILGSVLEKNGATDEQIVEVLKSLSPEKQQEAVSDLIDRGIINVDEKKSEKDKRTDDIEEKTYNKLLKGGVSKDVALSNSKLFGWFFNKYLNSDNENTRKEAEKLANSLEVRYNVPAENELLPYGNAPASAVEEAILQQSAYHGTPHRFDNFSNEHIGKGEGAQAHGWGMYFAEDKSVSESYRTSLSRGLLYNGKRLNYNDSFRNIILLEIKAKGKENYINELNQKLVKYNEDLENFKNEHTPEEIREDDYLDLELSNLISNVNYAEEQIEEAQKIDETKITQDNGQLYEVDIPENDVLLDEQKTFQEQPEKVKTALFLIDRELKGALYAQLNKINKSKNVSGREIYKALGSILLKQTNDESIKDTISYADMLASKKLNEHGIKGITYDGRQDGRCFVVFDDSAINIMKTYYQGKNDYNNDNIYQRTDKTKYLTDNEVEQLEKDKENFRTYIGKLINGELKPETQIRVLRKLPSAYNKISNLKGKKVVINQEIYKKIIDLPNIYQKNHYVDRTRALKLPELISDPLYILQSTSEGNEHRYVIVTNSKGKNPGEKLSVIFEPKNNAVVVSAYDEVINISEEKKAGRVLYDKKKELSKTTIASKARTNDNSNKSITNNGTDFNPSVNKDEGTTYFQAAETAGTDGDNVEAAIKEYKEKGTESKYFKKWFGDSKVVDKNGKPLIVYHGTESDEHFEIFETNSPDGTPAIYFSSNKKTANSYSVTLPVYKVYLKIENPFIVDAQGQEYNNFTAEMRSNIDWASRNGYDGVIIKNIRDGWSQNEGGAVADTYIVFNPEQIKSVDNRGTFDADNPNIYFQRKKPIVSPNQLSLFDTLTLQNQVRQEQIFQPQVEDSKEVQTEIPEKIEKKDLPENQDISQETQEIKDTGDSLLGNLKRDRKTYTWEELDKMNDLLRKKYLSKSYVYQLDSIENYKKQGLSEKSIAFIHLIYSKINARPSSYYEGEKDAQKIFFDSVHEIMDKTIKFAKENNDYLTNYSKNSQRNESLFQSVFPDTENKKPYNIFRAYPEHNKKAIIVGGNKLIEYLHFGYSTSAELEKSLAKIKILGTDTKKEKDKNTLTGWQTRFEILETKYRGFALGDKKSKQIIKNDIPTKELAQELAERLYDYLKNAKSNDYTENYERLRNHIPRRKDGQNVKPEALIEVFGFRGINFGNWTNQKERQNFVNLAYDSFHDLAELLNLPPKAMSLGGKLGIAFGAQGRKGAAGHFIPEFNEINLTRKSGAGALAHEWWHALDYYFGDVSKGQDFSGKAALSLKEQGELRPEIFEAMKQINNVMKYSPLTEAELKDRSSKIEANIHGAIEYYQNDIKNSFKKSKNSDEINKFVDDIVKNAATMDIKAETDNLNKKYLSLLDERRQTWDNLGKLGSLLYHCQRLQQVNDLAQAGTKYSKYYESASRLNTLEKGHGKGYWTSDTELGARAFASYILNKISENNYSNYFLSEDESVLYTIDFEVLLKQLDAKAQGKEYKGDINVKWYPSEKDERERIFSAFDSLFKQIKTREEDGKTILYQEENDEEEPEEKLIAGYTYEEIMNKMIQLNDELEQTKDKTTEERLVSEISILTNAFDHAENPDRYSPDVINENALNVWYIMQGLELPSSTVETELKTPQGYRDLLERHKQKLEKQESDYYGYYRRENDKAIITIMQGSNSSTVLHELAHFFLDSLNELAKIDDKAKEQLEAIDKWLGRNGEYTIAQHEKFARSFEAYLYKGKAPNNKLRQVFENFKAWLKSVYTHVSQLTEKGADISPEVEELFDKIFAGDSYYEERQEANRILREVKKAARKESTKEIVNVDESKLDDVQKRHKEVCYSILASATGKSKKYLKSIFETKSKSNAIIKKREKIEELLDKADDKITVSGGFKKEWSEFFSDTGVSYENDEVGGDFELAWSAYETIVRGAYRNPEKMLNDELSQRGEYFEREINNAQRQYKLLLKEFKTGNRNSALSAIYEWLEGLNPEIREDYENKFVYDAALIERDENFDKFDKAKQEIAKRALELNTSESPNDNEQFKELVKSIMKNLDFLQPSDKAKMTVNILDCAGKDFLISKLDSIMDIAKTMEDVRFRNNLAQDIHRELQTTKNVKKNGRTVGKYNYKTNKIFEHLRELDRLTPERANEIRLSEEALAQAEDEGLSPEHKLYNKFLSFKANGRTFADTELMKDIYDEIMKLKFIGKTAKSELELQEKFNEISDVDELIEIVQNKKDSNLILKGYINAFGNLESTVNAIFNGKIKDKYATEILYAETQSQAWQHQVKQKFEKETAKIYNLPEFCWDKKILDYLGEKHTYQEIRRKYDKEGNVIKERLIDRTLIKMQIIVAYIYDKNSVLSERLKNQFGEETLLSMFDELSEADIRFAQLLMKTAQSFYPLVNKVFIRKFGLDLPKVSCYFPSTPERGSEVDLYNEFNSKSLGNGFTKARAQSELIPMDFHNPVATLYSHIEGVGKFVFMSEALDRANIRFKDKDLKRVIINKFGEDVYRTLEQNLINVTYKKEAQIFSGINKVLDNMIGNWIQANIAIKPIVGLKQLLSANNYAIDMPYMTWQTGFLKALANPKATIDYMMKIPYLKARFEGNFSNEFLKAQVENSAFAASKKLKDACTMFVRIGDIGAIIFGGKPYVDYLIKEKKMSEEDAIKQFIVATNRSQQSSAVSSLSNFQINMTRNPVGKLMIAFKNAPQQYVRMCGDAIVSYKNGDITLQKCAQLLFQFGYLQPFLYTMMTSGSVFRFLFSGDDDDLINDLKMSLFDFNSSALPIFGDIYKFALNKLAYKEKYMPMNMPLTGDIENEIMKISKEDVSLSDYLEFIGYLGLHVGLGYNYKAAVSMGEGVVDIAQGDVVQGTMKAAGYTDKRAKHISDK